MNHPINLKTTPPLLITLTLLCFGLLPRTQAVVPPPDGGYPGFNTAEGQNALFSLTTGAANTAVGWSSLSSNAEGSFNTATGAGALLFNTADQNTAVGAAALLFTTTGVENTAIGAAALLNNTVGVRNTAIGSQALANNTDSSNTAIGVDALLANTTGFNNAAFGIRALETNIDGHDNTAIGNLALSGNTSGIQNTAVGRHAGDGITSGNNNMCMGTFSGTSITTGTGIITIGPVSGVHSIFGQVDDRTYIANIRNAAVDSGTAQLVYVDADGRLGTNPTPAGPERSVPRSTTPKGARLQGMSDDAKQAMLNRKVEALEATVTQQQKQIQALTSGLQKVSAQLAAASPSGGGLEASKFATGRIRRGGSAPQVVVNP